MKNEKSKRVLFVAHLGDLKGGADRILLKLVENLDRSQIEPLVLVPLKTSQSMVELLRQSNIPYLRWHYTSWINLHHRLPRKVYRLLANLSAAAYLSLVLHRRKIDLVYTNSLYSPLGALLAVGLRVPHIWHVQEFVEEDIGANFDWGRALSMDIVDKTSSLVICNSQAVYNKMARFIPVVKLKMIYYGIFENAAPSPPPRTLKKPLQISIVGRIEETKGQKDAILAIHQLVRDGMEVTLHIAGEGTAANKTQLKQLIAQLNIEEHIIWHGFVDPFSIYELADINLVCSRSEAFGLVVIESMSAGCALVGANAGAIPELLGDEERGLLYDAADHQMLAKQIRRLVEEPDLYQNISTQGQDFARRHFLLRDYVDNIQAALSSL